MPKQFQLEILGPDKTLFQGTVISVSAQAKDGSIGILADHAPLITALDKKTVFFIDANNEKQGVEISGGILKVENNKATILTTDT
ncbi:MAG: ATP synthase F1 subunit epsilon [Candidatus Saganbacteria bacterium]|nr:ATP synthase F1 subunit epsilon [Candidatus Saganbacteria bacterium]